MEYCYTVVLNKKQHSGGVMKYKGSKLRLLIFVILLIIFAIICFYEDYKYDEIQRQQREYEKQQEVEQQTLRTEEVKVIPVKHEVVKASSKEFTDDEEWLLLKIAMAEAEGQSTQAKALVMQTVLNRVADDKFPNTIHDVIYQCSKPGTYQFSPIGNGRFDKVVPNNDCYEALKLICQGYEEQSQGCLYFEACKSKDNWHSRNLTYLFEVDTIRFYK